MPITRVVMLLGLTLPLIGLIFGMSTLNGGDAKTAMFTELACLAAGAAIFYAAHAAEKKKGT
jgi:hypothetical protein